MRRHTLQYQKIRKYRKKIKSEDMKYQREVLEIQKFIVIEMRQMKSERRAKRIHNKNLK